LSSQAFNRALEEKAIQFGTGSDEDNIYASIESLAEHKEAAFSYLGMALSRPRFDSDAIERTRRQTLSIIIQQEQQPGYLVHRKWLELAFGNHPYAHPQTGFKNSVERLSGSDLQAAREHYLTRENILIAVVGDTTPEELAKLLDTHLKDLSPKYAPDSTVAEIEVQAAAEPALIDFDIPQTIITFGLQGMKRSHPDYYGAYVMNQILGGGGSLTNRLGLEIRERRGLSYGVGSYLEPMAHGATWRGNLATRNDQAATSLTVLRSTIKDFAEKGPTDQELSDARKFLIGSFVLNLDNNAEIAKFLISMQLNELGMDYLEKRNSLMEAVTRQDVAAIAKRLINPDKLLIVMAGRPKLDAKEK
jgi:zinc protease